VAGVVLAAGIGSRLAPLTWQRPKALCPVGGAPLVDHALGHLRALGLPAAVNAHHHAAAVEAHVAGRAHVSVEDRLLGTAGALGRLRPWLDGRAAVVLNADAVHAADLSRLLRGWDGATVRLLVADPPGTEFGPRLRLCGALMPWADVASLPAEPAGLYDQVWKPAAAAGRLDVLAGTVAWFDCGTPRAYLAANLWVSGGRSVIGEGSRVEGRIVRTVVWPGSVVHRQERLVDAIRAGRTTVLVRDRGRPFEARRRSTDQPRPSSPTAS